MKKAVVSGNAEIIELDKALKDKKLSFRIRKALEGESKPKDQFEAFNNAKFKQSFVIIIKRNAEIKIDLKEHSILKILFIIEKMTTCQIIETLTGKNSFYSANYYFEEGSKAEIIRKIDLRENNVLSQQAIAEKRVNARQSNVWLNGKKLKASIWNNLVGNESFLEQNDLLLTNKDQNFNIQLTVLHKGINTKSETKMKNVLSGNTRQVFDGLIKILPKAQKTNSYLEVNSMMLSDNASSTNIPNLEIEADEVKATHSATVEHLDEDALFYLTTRGLKENEAKDIVIKSFLESCLIKFSQEIQEKAKEWVEEKWNANYNNSGIN